MGTTRIQSRLLLHTLAIIAGCELGIMFLLPVILPGATRWVEAGTDTLLLTVTAGPLLWWRFSRRLAGEKAVSGLGEAASSIRRVRAVGIVGLTCVAALALCGAAAMELAVRTAGAKAEHVDEFGRLRVLGRALGAAAALRALDPSPTRQRTFDAALEECEAVPGILRDHLAGENVDSSPDSEIGLRLNDALAAIRREIALGRTIGEVFHQRRTDPAALDELLAACTAAVERLDALNKSIAANDPSGVAEMRLLGRVLGLLLVSALVLVWLLAIGPAVQRAAKVDEALRRGQALLQAIVECTPDGIVAADSAGNIRLANPAVERMLGYSPGELVGQPVTTIIPDGVREPHLRGFERVVAGGEPRLLGRLLEVAALRCEKTGGGEVPVELSLGIVKHNQEILFTASLRSISERKAAELRMRRLAGAVEAADSAIMLTDLNGHIVQVNPAFSRITGYSEDEVVGQNPRLLKSGQHPLEFYRQLWTTIRAGKTWTGRMVNRRKDGSLIHIAAGISPVLNDDGRITGYVGIQRDVTAEIDGERALRDARDHAEAVNADLVGLNESHTALFACHTTADVARVLTDTLVRNFDAHFARVWLRRPADLCSECALASHCPTKQECLHLMASSGFYTHIDGPHRRVPLGTFKIGLIAQGAGKTISHDVVHDERVHDRQWAAEHGLRSFVGLPLHHDGRVIGVMAMFSRKDLPEHVLETTDILAMVGSAAIANVELIDSHRVATQAAETAARVDKLTGLPNRALLLDRLQHAMERAKRLPEYHFAVMFLDFDRFKIVNDSLGHEFGDMLLRAIAARLRENLRTGDSTSRSMEGTTVARLGGDEFVVLLDGIKKPEDAATVANRLLKNLGVPYPLGEHEVRQTASIGIVCSHAEYDKADEILRDADTAMYEAKARGKACFVMFDADMQTAVQHRLQIENDMRAAIGSDQFFLVYQPIVSLENGELRGVEALIRWNHPTRGLVMPGEFIPIAEETRLILPLSNWIFEQACTQFTKWRQQAPNRAPAYVSVNLSRIQLDEKNLVEQIVQTVQRAGMEPGQLQLEVTESEIMRNRETAKRILGALKAVGVRLAVDDFGTGHSSLSCLHEFPFDVLKIDRSFIINLGRGREFIALTHSVVTLAEYLGMACVAEGVEKRDQIAALQSMSCTCGQGYYFGKPMSAEALIDGKWMDGYRTPAADPLVFSDLTGR